MNFEIALENMRKGQSVKRKCWKDEMHLKLMTANSYDFHKDQLIDDVNSDRICEMSGLFFILIHGKEESEEGVKQYSSQLKWVPLQSDLLALDWEHV